MLEAFEGQTRMSKGDHRFSGRGAVGRHDSTGQSRECAQSRLLNHGLLGQNPLDGGCTSSLLTASARLNRVPLIGLTIGLVSLL